MRAVVQRVRSATVSVDGRTVGRIDAGLLVLVGCETSDAHPQADWMADKLVNLRVFSDDEGKMNRSVQDAAGGILLVSNFTVAGDAQKGRRPSFDRAMPGQHARDLFDYLTSRVSATGIPTETGAFGEAMLVTIHNDGPVTLIIESPRSLTHQ